jgi:hypothetical protein
MRQRKKTDMKFRLGLTALALMPWLAHAEEADKQGIYQISSTAPLTVSTTTSVRSAQLANTVRGVRIAPKVDAHCKVGDVTVVATANDTLFFAFAAEYVKIQPTDGNYVACLGDIAGGLVWVDPIKP